MQPSGGERRVVIAIRLHAALMAIRAGHYVIHLAYERKGFGAFKDLGLDAWVHNVNRFEPARVLAQIQKLTADEVHRQKYDDYVRMGFERAAVARNCVIEDIRDTAKYDKALR